MSRGLTVRPSCGMCNLMYLHGEANVTLTPVDLQLYNLYTEYDDCFVTFLENTSGPLGVFLPSVNDLCSVLCPSLTTAEDAEREASSF